LEVPLAHVGKHNAVVSCDAIIRAGAGALSDDFPGGGGAGDGSGSRRGARFHVPHRDGGRVEVGEPIHVGGDRPWMCVVKLLGRHREEPREGTTHTLLVRTGRGESPDDARREALAQLSQVYGSPVEPPPMPVISHKPSDPRLPVQPSEARGWGWRLRRTLARLVAWVGGAPPPPPPLGT
jgi:hypothetical protein